MRRDPDARESHGLAQQRPRRGRASGRTQLCGNRLHRYRARREASQQPRDALEIGGRGRDDVDPAVRVVDPVHRDLVDPQAARSASTSSSVSKNHPVSVTWGSSRCATSARIALNPHCASEKRAARADFRIRL